MSKNKITELVSTVTSLVSKTGSNSIKETIGDSVNNNRSVTVNQVIRYLNSTGTRKNRKLAKVLKQVHDATRFEISVSRYNRTDAHSLSELTYVLDDINSFQDRSMDPKKTILTLLRNA